MSERPSERPAIPMFQRATWSVAETTQMTGLGVTTIYDRMKNKTLLSRKEGKKRLIVVATVLKMLKVDRNGEPIEPRKQAS